MKRHHVHQMVPNRLPKPSHYKCNSCEFRCTPNALGIVKGQASDHVLIKASDPRAKVIWNGSYSKAGQ